MKSHGYIFITISLIFSLSSCQQKTNNNEIKEIDFHSQLQYNYLKDDIENISIYANGTEELSKPNGYQIYFNNNNNVLYKIELKSDIDNRTYSTRESSFIFNNLYLNTNYQYIVQKNEEIIKEDSFITSSLYPRNIDVEGVTNFRDLGGSISNSNTQIKQGMIYRSAKFSENGSNVPLITNKGRNTIINELKIKSEIDLRLTSNNETGGITSSVIGNDINYFSIPMTFDGGVFIENIESLKLLFETISKKEIYPFVFHCSIGTDRTGFVAFILNALLDAKIETLYRDYLFSNFGLIGGSRNQTTITNYLSKFALYDGDTIKEQVTNYLLDIKVKKAHIDSFISIMTN